EVRQVASRASKPSVAFGNVVTASTAAETPNWKNHAEKWDGRGARRRLGRGWCTQRSRSGRRGEERELPRRGGGCFEGRIKVEVNYAAASRRGASNSVPVTAGMCPGPTSSRASPSHAWEWRRSRTWVASATALRPAAPSTRGTRLARTQATK